MMFTQVIVGRSILVLPEYYRLRGWDENGIPKKEKLKELGLNHQPRP